MNDQWLNKALREIRDGERLKWAGICGNVERRSRKGTSFTPCWFFDVTVPRMRELFKRWPHYSGDQTFPVPGPRGGRPDRAFDRNKMWDRRSSYARLRWNLLEFMIRETNGA